MRVAAGLLDVHDLVEDGPVITGQERAAVDDHVDLVGTGFHGLAGLGELDVEERLAGREARGDARDLDR